MLCGIAQDGDALQLIQGLLQEVVGVGGAVLFIIGLLRRGERGVIPHVHAKLGVLLCLGNVVVGNGVIVVGHLGGGVLMVTHGGSNGVLIAIEEIVPDQECGH